MSEPITRVDEPKRQGPLHGITLPASNDLTVLVSGPAARIILRGGSEVGGGVKSAFGITLPSRPNSASAAGDGGRVVIWLGPDEWLLVAPEEEPAAIWSALEIELSTCAHSLTDVSHRQIGIEITGRLAARVLSAGCPLDLRLCAFASGTATRTIFMKSEIVLWRRAENRFHVDVWRSFAPYLVGHLSEAIAGAAGL